MNWPLSDAELEAGTAAGHSAAARAGSSPGSTTAIAQARPTVTSPTTAPARRTPMTAADPPPARRTPMTPAAPPPARRTPMRPAAPPPTRHNRPSPAARPSQARGASVATKPAPTTAITATCHGRSRRSVANSPANASRPMARYSPRSWGDGANPWTRGTSIPASAIDSGPRAAEAAGAASAAPGERSPISAWPRRGHRVGPRRCQMTTAACSVAPTASQTATGRYQRTSSTIYSNRPNSSSQRRAATAAMPGTRAQAVLRTASAAINPSTTASGRAGRRMARVGASRCCSAQHKRRQTRRMSVT